MPEFPVEPESLHEYAERGIVAALEKIKNNFLRGLASVDEPNSGIFKLKKFRTDKKFISNFFMCYNQNMNSNLNFPPKHGHKQIKICVSGAADTTPFGPETLEIAKELGREIAKSGAIHVPPFVVAAPQEPVCCGR
jgi:hypothetical protein